MVFSGRRVPGPPPGRPKALYTVWGSLQILELNHYQGLSLDRSQGRGRFPSKPPGWTPQERTDPSSPGQPPEAISLLQDLPLHTAGTPWKERLDSRWSSALVLIGRWPCSGGLQPHFPAPMLFSTRRPCLRDKLTSQLSSWACLLPRGGQGVLTNCLT